jgi:hypothetical protein
MKQVLKMEAKCQLTFKGLHGVTSHCYENIKPYTISGMFAVWKNETGLTFVIIIQSFREFHIIHTLYKHVQLAACSLVYIQ